MTIKETGVANALQTLHEDCLLYFLTEQTRDKKITLSEPLVTELESMKPIFRSKKYVSFPMNILLKKLETLLH
jgi:hypothetical protein